MDRAWVVRSQLKKTIRHYFDRLGFLEMDTPTLVTCPGNEIHLGYFGTDWVDHQNRKHSFYLIPSPEVGMKRALAHGAKKIYQLSRCYRNFGEQSAWHHPEFTMLEWYESGLSFDGMISQTLALLGESLEVLKRSEIANEVRFVMPSKTVQMTVAQAFQEFAGLSLVDNDPSLAAQAMEKGVRSVRLDDDFETAFFKILIERIEPALESLGVVVLKDYPPSQAALAKVDGTVAKRFEIYVGRIELCNGFEELTDAAENRKRFVEAAAKREKLGKQPIALDEDFLRDLEKFPACSGNALGFDRWLAILLGEHSLDRSIPFRSSLF